MPWFTVRGEYHFAIILNLDSVSVALGPSIYRDDITIPSTENANSK